MLPGYWLDVFIYFLHLFIPNSLIMTTLAKMCKYLPLFLAHLLRSVFEKFAGTQLFLRILLPLASRSGVFGWIGTRKSLKPFQDLNPKNKIA